MEQELILAVEKALAQLKAMGYGDYDLVDKAIEILEAALKVTRDE